MLKFILALLVSTPAWGVGPSIISGDQLKSDAKASSDVEGLVKKPSVVSAYASTAQTAINSGVAVTVEFDTEVGDSDGFFDTSTHEFTPTIPGWYFVSTTAVAESTVNNAIRAYVVNLLVDGVSVGVDVPIGDGGTAQSDSIAGNINKLLYLDGTQSVSVTAVAYTTSGTWNTQTNNQRTNFSAYYVTN